MTSLENSSKNTQSKNLISIDPGSCNPKQVDEDRKLSQIEVCDVGIREIIWDLTIPQNLFKETDVYDKIKTYINVHERFLYSSISNVLFAYFDENQGNKDNLSLMSNLEKLFLYSEEQDEIKTHHAIIKLWDHVNLANRQYTMLKLSDGEYKKKFEENKEAFKIEFKSELSKEINSQMLIMVSIFTALAFLIFGSMSSLDGIFEQTNLPLSKTLSIACVWGICVSNMIFLFLSCAGKMTNLPLSKEDKTSCCFFKKHSLFCWTNFILIALLSLSLFCYSRERNSTINIEAKEEIQTLVPNFQKDSTQTNNHVSNSLAEKGKAAEEAKNAQSGQHNH